MRCRYSPEAQVQHGVSPEAQEERIRAYATMAGLELVAFIREKALLSQVADTDPYVAARALCPGRSRPVWPRGSRCETPPTIRGGYPEGSKQRLRHSLRLRASAGRFVDVRRPTAHPQHLLNMVSDLVRNPQGRVAQRVVEIGEAHVCTSVVVAAELRYGVAKKASPRLTAQVKAVLGALEVLPFETPADEPTAGFALASSRRANPSGATTS